MERKIIKLLESYVYDEVGHTEPYICTESIPSIAKDIVNLLKNEFTCDECGSTDIYSDVWHCNKCGSSGGY